MKVGYARVSTVDQNLDLQFDALKAYGCEQIFQDKISGVTDKRRGLNEALQYVRSEDI
jgi:DNA invertase Pin-like site-specific DNA recombinase